MYTHACIGLVFTDVDITYTLPVFPANRMSCNLLRSDLP